MGPCGVVFGFALVAALFAALNQTELSGRARQLQSFARTLAHPEVDAPISPFGSQRNWAVRGTYHQRRVLVLVGEPQPHQVALKLEVQRRGLSFDLRARAPTLTTWLSGVQGDGRFLTRRGSWGAARLVAQPPLEPMLRSLFRNAGVERVALEGGWLTIEAAAGGRSYDGLLGALIGDAAWVAAECDRADSQSRILITPRESGLAGPRESGLAGPRVLRERMAAAVRCPFCHDELTDAAVVTPCRGCGTTHHAECIAEHGCVVLGCRRRSSA